jgi:hypothetical protein
MNLHHAWFDLRDTSRDVELSRSLERYLGRLKEMGR